MYTQQLDVSAVWLDDVPLSPTAIHYYDQYGNAINVSQFATTHTITLYDPVGEPTILAHAVQGNHINVTWPTTSPFILPGVYELVTVVTDEDDARLASEPWYIVAQSNDGWLDLETTRARWADAPMDDAYLWAFLDAARSQCEAYAPAIPQGTVIPERYRQAQLQQARALYMTVISNQNDSVGVDGYQVRTFPLDWNIKALLRPKTGRPVML